MDMNLMTSHTDYRIAETATAQNGLITTLQLTSLGMSRSAIHRRAQNGRLIRVHRGVYAVGHSALSPVARMHSATLAIGEDSVVSHWSAAQLHRLLRSPVRHIDVIVPRRCRSLHGVRVNYSSTLLREETTVVDLVPVATVERTLLDLSSRTDEYRLANLMHEADYIGSLDLERLVAIADRNVSHHGVSVLRRALELHREGSAGTKSGLERTALMIIQQLGFPEPSINVPVQAGGRWIEVDWLFRDHRLIVEIDGPGHLRARTRRADQRRDELLNRAGFQVIRLNAADIEGGGLELVRKLAPVLTQRTLDTVSTKFTPAGGL